MLILEVYVLYSTDTASTQQDMLLDLHQIYSYHYGPGKCNGFASSSIEYKHILYVRHTYLVSMPNCQWITACTCLKFSLSNAKVTNENLCPRIQWKSCIEEPSERAALHIVKKSYMDWSIWSAVDIITFLYLQLEIQFRGNNYFSYKILIYIHCTLNNLIFFFMFSNHKSVKSLINLEIFNKKIEQMEMGVRGILIEIQSILTICHRWISNILQKNITFIFLLHLERTSVSIVM